MTNMMMLRARGWPAALLFVIFHSSFVIPVKGHPADNSQARIKVEPQHLEFRLTFNLYSLQQFHRLDIDGDGRITKQELDAAEPVLREYLKKHVLVTINGQDSDLGEARSMARMWPAESAGADIPVPDYGQRFVDFTFEKNVTPLVETVWLGFDIFKETGDLHVVHGAFEQDGKPEEVTFDRSEPEYLWDTGFDASRGAEHAATNAATGDTDPQTAAKSHGLNLWVVAIFAIAATATLLLLRKVKRISRGSFCIGPREHPGPDDE